MGVKLLRAFLQVTKTTRMLMLKVPFLLRPRGHGGDGNTLPFLFFFTNKSIQLPLTFNCTAQKSLNFYLLNLSAVKKQPWVLFISTKLTVSIQQRRPKSNVY